MSKATMEHVCMKYLAIEYICYIVNIIMMLILCYLNTTLLYNVIYFMLSYISLLGNIIYFYFILI